MIFFNVKNVKTKGNFLNVEKPIVINEKDKIGIIGTNGAGKSSFVRVLMQDLIAKIEMEKNISNDEIGIQMQENFLYPNLKVKEYFELIFLKKLKNSKDTEDIYALKDKKIDKLSGGEKQMFILFIVTHLDKKMYIFDELTTGLDYNNREKMIKKLQEKNFPTFCLVSHYFEEIDLLCNKLLILEKGNVIEFDYIQNILEKYKLHNNFIYKDKLYYTDKDIEFLPKEINLFKKSTTKNIYEYLVFEKGVIYE